MRNIAITVNGVRRELDVEPRQLLVYALREQLGLTGTNVGCDTTTCAASRSTAAAGGQGT